MNKRFKLTKEEIKPLALGHGSCVASDMITVDGELVGFMYREDPDAEIDSDSGWRFMSGFESDEYANIAENFSFYDVNTIANCDPEIIPLLTAPIGSAFERAKDVSGFQKVSDHDNSQD
jgi:hypothetical protein